MSEVTWVEVEIGHETDLAILVSIDGEDPRGGNGIWIPKSQISDSSDDLDVGSNVEIEIPVWLAKQKGLV